MFITEYRIPLPLTIEEYNIGNLYTLVEMAKMETGGGEGVEILCNEPYTEFIPQSDSFKRGQYTYRVYYIAEKLPPFIRKLTPQGCLEVHEEIWNTFPICKIEKRVNLVNDGFSVNIQTIVCNDKGDQDNVHGLSYDLLKKRNIVYLDIVNDPTLDKSLYDLTKYKSVRTHRGPFIGNWIETSQPIITCYKLVNTEFKWFGIQTRVEKLIQSFEKKMSILFHRKLVCSMDKWHELSIEDIRKIEKQGAIDLQKSRFEGTVQGIVLNE